MIRTQIYLPKSLYQDIALIAKREKKPKAAVIRDAVIKSVAKKQKKKNAGSALLWLAKNPIKGLPPDLSMNIDKYLYE